MQVHILSKVFCFEMLLWCGEKQAAQGYRNYHLCVCVCVSIHSVVLLNVQFAYAGLVIVINIFPFSQ